MKEDVSISTEADIRQFINYQASTRRALAEMLAAAGLTHPRELGPEHVMHRVSRHEVKSFDTLYDFLAPNALLQGCASHHAVFRDYWDLADPDRRALRDAIRAVRVMQEITSHRYQTHTVT